MGDCIPEGVGIYTGALRSVGAGLAFIVAFSAVLFSPMLVVPLQATAGGCGGVAIETLAGSAGRR